MFDKKLLYTLAGIALVTGLAVGMTGLSESQELTEIHETVQDLELEALEEEDSSKAAGPLYLMREYKGCIAVYHMGEAEPFLELDTRVKFLPDYDRALLEKGIEIADSEELAALIEDYIS